jgi:soluble lytic murein transglycosylase
MKPLIALSAALLLATVAGTASAQVDDKVIVDAREALRKNDRPRLAALRTMAVDGGHPLAQWADYWELSNRLATAQQAEVEAFYKRWTGTYVEDRLRNDWLLELGRRRDWAEFARDHPRFRMNDDREVACYALLVQHRAGKDVAEAARAAGFAQRDSDDGCQLLASTLFDAKKLTADDVWHEARLSLEFNRPAAARAAAAMIGKSEAKAVAELLADPARYLARRPHAVAHASPRSVHELLSLAVMRLAGTDPDAAASQLERTWASELPSEQAAVAWGAVAKQAALKLMPDAFGWYQRAWTLQQVTRDPHRWSDDWLAWKVRAALRAQVRGSERWPQVLQAIDAMTPAAQADPAWVYWKGRALLARAPRGEAGEAARARAHELIQSVASPFTFYGQLAIEDAGQRVALPAPPAAPTEAERTAAAATPGLQRSLQLIALGLRNEGVREWNFTLRGMDDRALLAAAQLGCEREVWDRCINTSERIRAEIDVAQRYPTPLREQVVAAARAAEIDPALVYGLIRQESRFIMDARSSVGASGLMQLMPATARWTAKKAGIDWRPELITDREVNLKLGTTYLKLVLDDFGGSAAMAAAAYNAGPNRPRRWREGAVVEAAAWAEGIPFNETRDYVKKVLSNATVYAVILNSAPTPALKPRLGGPIGPRDGGAPAPNQELP